MYLKMSKGDKYSNMDKYKDDDLHRLALGVVFLHSCCSPCTVSHCPF